MNYHSIIVPTSVVLILTVPVLLAVAYVRVAKRKTMASMQRRLEPYGLQKGLISLTKNLSSLDAGVVTNYALYILVTGLSYLYLSYLPFTKGCVLIILLLTVVNMINFITIDENIIGKHTTPNINNMLQTSVKYTLPAFLLWLGISAIPYIAGDLIVYYYQDNDIDEATPIIANVESLLPQLELFIRQYESFIRQNDISVITTGGTLSIEVYSNVPDSITNSWGSRIFILDGLINTRVSNIRDLINQLINLEPSSSNLSAIISDLSGRLQTLIARYGHIT